mgnify:CR=1 FL=1
MVTIIKVASIIILISTMTHAQVPQGVETAIQSALAGDHIMTSFEMDKQEFGFSKGAGLSDIQAGLPMKIYTITFQEIFECE